MTKRAVIVFAYLPEKVNVYVVDVNEEEEKNLRVANGCYINGTNTEDQSAALHYVYGKFDTDYGDGKWSEFESKTPVDGPIDLVVQLGFYL